MTVLQRKVLANLHELGGKPLPLAALFAGTGVSSREEVRRVIEALVKQRYIEECLGTSRMPFYRRTDHGTGVEGS
jgi:hypothetical protein